MERNYEAIVIYYFIINILSFIIFYIDKQKAIKNKWRIKEKTLFLFFILGGVLGGFFSMKYFHHKTRKPKFYIVGLCSFFLHLFLIITFLKYFN